VVDAFDVLVACVRAAVQRRARAAEPPESALVTRLAPDGRVADLVAQVGDWAMVLEAAASQGVAPLLAREALQAAGGALAADARALLTSASRRATVAALDASRELAAVVGVLESAGVAALPYKGPALALDAYGDVAAREVADLDFVVAPDDADAAAAALSHAGYAPAGGVPWAAARYANAWQAQVRFVGAGSRLPVELHWRFCDRKLPWNPDVRAVLARAATRVVAGARVAIPAAEDQLILVLLHAARHGWDRLDAFACAGAILDRGVDGAEVLARAGAVGGRRAVLVGLDVTSRLLAIALPASLAEACGADANVARLSARALARVRRGSGDARRDARLHLALLDTTWARVRYAALAALLPTDADVASVELPAGLRFLYPLVRLARLAARRGATAATR
jgi:hypothetical protein